MRPLVLTLLLLVAAAAPAAHEEGPSPCRVGVRWHEGERGGQLLGEVLRGDIARHLPGWDDGYASYEPAAPALQVLADVDAPVEIVCVLGTWCHDSEREVPRFWKVLDEAANPHLVLTMFAVGRGADTAADSVLAELGFDEHPRLTYAADLVPTFVFLRDGAELGRIIETPTTSLEEDAAALLDAAPAAPAWR
jgi:thiol-disulfide isomerase/thioredoxin